MSNKKKLSKSTLEENPFSHKVVEESKDMKNSIHISRKTIGFSVISLVLFILVAGCNPILRTPKGQSGNCPYELATDYHTYDFGSLDSKYVYVLIDQSYDYKFTPKDLELIANTITPNIFSGDRLIVAWINLENGTQTIIFDEKVERERIPQFPSTHIQPQVTPTVTLSPITTIAGEQQQLNQTIEAENQAINEKYACKIGEWNAMSDEIFQKWDKEQKEEIESFINNANSILSPSIAKSTSGGKLLYESLSTASQMLQSSINKRQHQRYILIVFSDMNDWRPAKPDDIKIDLKGINTLIVSQHCDYEINCTVKIEWESQLTSFGAINPTFIVKEDDISKTLYNYLSIIP